MRSNSRRVSVVEEPRRRALPIRRLIFSVMVAFLFALAGLRLFRNRWAERVWQRIWLVLFVYACVILGMGILEIVRRSGEGNFP